MIRLPGKLALNVLSTRLRDSFRAKLSSGAPKNLSLILVAAAPCLVGAYYIWRELGLASGLGFPLDDPWIHLRFAQNLARGQGLCFNPGEPVAGSTSPLWTVLLALLHLAQPFESAASIVLPVKVLGVTLLAFASVFGFLVARRLTGSAAAALVAGLFFGLTDYQSWGAVSGMEVPLYLLLTMIAVHLSLRERSLKNDLGLGAVLALAVYARPECLILFPCLVVERALRKDVRGVLVVAAAYGLGLAPYFLLNFWLSGSIFPTTFLAKAEGHGLFAALGSHDLALLRGLLLESGPLYFRQFLAHLYRANPLYPAGLLAGAMSMAYAFFRRGRGGSLFIPLVALFYAAIIGAVSPFRGADFQTGRYVANQTGLATLAAVIGYFGLIACLKRFSPKAARVAAGLLLAVGAFNAAVAGRWMLHNHLSNVESINAIQVSAAKWLSEHGQPGQTVMTPDVGAIGYLSGMRVIDLGGLVTPKTLEFYRAHRGEDQLARRYAQELKPDYLVFFPDFNPELAALGPTVYVAAKADNTASQYVFGVRARVFAGVVLTGLKLEPRPSELVVVRYEGEVHRP